MAPCRSKPYFKHFKDPYSLYISDGMITHWFLPIQVCSQRKMFHLIKSIKPMERNLSFLDSTALTKNLLAIFALQFNLAF
jgi:hypothetical protein